MSPAGTFWLFTCEHGGNRVPPRWRECFRGAHAALESHRGWDLGALSLFRTLLRRYADAGFHATVTRLLVDLNRSEGHPRHFSEYTRGLGHEARERILAKFYRPYRAAVSTCVAEALTSHPRVVHIGVHTFTPVLAGRERAFEVGLLYDPSRRAERAWTSGWAAALRGCSDLRVRRNQPYRGASDGLTTTLRRRFGPRYLGIELEVNQALWRGGRWDRAVRTALVESLAVLHSRQELARQGGRY